jgi:hypothetical protein
MVAPDPLEHDIALVGLPTTAPEHISSCIGRVKAFVARGRELSAMLDEQVLEHLRNTGRDLEIGDVNYYEGTVKVTKCLNPAAAADALLAKLGGDMDRFAECLSSDAFKHGHCSTVLDPEVYASLFQTTEKPDLKTGKPKRQLMSSNGFSRSRRRR